MSDEATLPDIRLDGEPMLTKMSNGEETPEMPMKMSHLHDFDLETETCSCGKTAEQCSPGHSLLLPQVPIAVEIFHDLIRQVLVERAKRAKNEI